MREIINEADGIDMQQIPKDLVYIPANKIIYTNNKCSEKKINKIAKHFDTDKFLVVPAFCLGGYYIITDGNHRVKAAIKNGYGLIPAIILTRQEFDYIKFSKKRVLNILVKVPEKVPVHQT